MTRVLGTLFVPEVVGEVDYKQPRSGSSRNGGTVPESSHVASLGRVVRPRTAAAHRCSDGFERPYQQYEVWAAYQLGGKGLAGGWVTPIVQEGMISYGRFLTLLRG